MMLWVVGRQAPQAGVTLATFLQAALIIFREGLEALLVVAALTAYVRKAGAPAHLRAIYLGVIAALISSVAIAWMLESIFADAQPAWAASLLALGAAFLMLYVSGWLFFRRADGAWQKYVSAKVEDALTQSSGDAIAAVAFLAVLREGIEVAVFVAALVGAGDASPRDVMAGIFVGGLALLVVFVVVRALAATLPLKLIFVCTSALLFIMSIKFVGNAIQILQQAQYIPATPVTGLAWIANLGLDPTWEAVIAQLAMIAISVATVAAFDRARRTNMAA